MATYLLVRAAVVGAASLLLAGCASGPVELIEPRPTITPTSPSTASPLPTVTAEPDQGACLIGDWALDEAQLNVLYDAVEAEHPGSFSIDATGGARLAFDGSVYRYEPDIELDLRVADVTGYGTVTGTVTAEYEVGRGSLTTLDGTSELRADLTIGGMEMAGTELFDPEMLDRPLADPSFTCGGELLLIEFSTGSTQVPLALHR